MATSSHSIGGTILLVVHDLDERTALRKLLEKGAFSVTEASDGQAGLHVLTAGARPSLVIVDFDAPAGSGAELLQLMSRYARLARLPVLVLSSAGVEPRGYTRIVASIKRPWSDEQLMLAVRAGLEGA